MRSTNLHFTYLLSYLSLDFIYLFLFLCCFLIKFIKIYTLFCSIYSTAARLFSLRKRIRKICCEKTLMRRRWSAASPEQDASTERAGLAWSDGVMRSGGGASRKRLLLHLTRNMFEQPVRQWRHYATRRRIIFSSYSCLHLSRIYTLLIHRVSR